MWKFDVSDGKNTEILSTCNRFSTTVCLHFLDCQKKFLSKIMIIPTQGSWELFLSYVGGSIIQKIR